MRRRTTAFTLVEIMVAGAISSILGLVIYGIATEGVISFARNVSINRSYGTARSSLSKIALSMQTAGHTPILIDVNGVDTPTAAMAAGIRMWRYDGTPQYAIATSPALTLTTTSFNITIASATDIPIVGDIIVIPALGFQAPVQTVTASGTSCTLKFAATLASNTYPVLTTAPTTPSGGFTCLDWTPVAFIAVGTELRYYSRFITGVTSVTTPANYKVIANLISATAAMTAGTSVTKITPGTPFSLGPAPTINVDLYAEAADYNQRNLGNGNTYSYIQAALAPRNPALLRSPY